MPIGAVYYIDIRSTRSFRCRRETVTMYIIIREGVQLLMKSGGSVGDSHIPAA